MNRLNRSLFGSPGIGSTPAPGYGAPRPAGAPRLWTPADGPIVPGGRGPAVVGAPGVKGMSVSTTPSGLYVARTARVPTGHPAVRGMGLGDTPSGLVVANSRGSAVPAGDPSLTTLPTRARPSGLHVIDGYMRNQAGVHVPNKYAYSEALTPVAKEASAGGAAIGPQGTAGAIWEDNGAFWDQPQRLDQHDGLASSQLGDAADRLSHDWGPRTQPFPPQQPPPPPDPPPGGGASPTHVAGGGTHQVAAGDTLWSIAEREYGDGSYARLIARANPHITDPNLVRPGDRLVLPPIPQPATAAP
ncbi:MAG: LysM peptidoglycan-binding domain-containing protein [Actinomycetota bacterium]